MKQKKTLCEQNAEYMLKQVVYTTFTPTHEDSNLRRTPPPKGKCIHPNLNPKIKTSAKNKYYTTNIVHFIHRASRALSTFRPTRVTVFIFTVSAFIFPTLTRNISNLFTVIPQHINTSFINFMGYSALLKTFHSHLCWVGLLCRCEPCWLNNTFINLMCGWPCIVIQCG